ncbi:hypothetical protein [Bacillus thuringiensis]|uniref:hypothetical protein n=1 Tax=Bacillus thuringiensis TaxID=1428 RepID=UPI0028684643|nr:hypothetical protein [Bacillus thuringiensis]
MPTYEEEQKINSLKKYRLGYDYVFLADTFTYKGLLISTMSVNVLFKVFDNKGNEKLFESNELNDQKLHLENGHSCYLTTLIKCYFDRKNILNFEPNISLLKDSGYTIHWEIDSYDKGVGECFVESENVSEEEFMNIMKKHIDQFDSSDNYPAQSCAYFTQEVKEEKGNERFYK